MLRRSVAKYTAAAESAVRAVERGGGVVPRKPRGMEELMVVNNHLLQELLKQSRAQTDLLRGLVSREPSCGSALTNLRTGWAASAGGRGGGGVASGSLPASMYEYIM